MLYKVNLVGKNCNANSVKVLASGDRDGFKSLTLRKLKRSNQSRISVADLKYLSLPKRSWRINIYIIFIYLFIYNLYIRTNDSFPKTHAIREKSFMLTGHELMLI